jgi:mannose-6-phosphate isomerase-like protein (cupin superfamily)
MDDYFSQPRALFRLMTPAQQRRYLRAGARRSHPADGPMEARMKGYCDDIEKRTQENTDFRRVVYTGHRLQLVLMAIQPGDEIGEEVHDDRDQFFRIEAGEGEIWIDGTCHRVKADDGVIVPQGARHNVISTGREPLRLYTIYGPPEHVDGTVHATCADAQAAHEHFDGRTTE